MPVTFRSGECGIFIAVASSGECWGGEEKGLQERDGHKSEILALQRDVRVDQEHSIRMLARSSLKRQLLSDTTIVIPASWSLTTTTI